MTKNNDNAIYITKMRDDVHIPSKRHEDGAFDIYANFPQEALIIEPFTSALVPTGLKSAFSPKYRIVFQERGSTGIKNLKVNAGCIDSGYRGEWFVLLYNANHIPVVITKETDHATLDILAEEYILQLYSKAICQAKVQDVPKVEIVEVIEEELLQFKSERGDGALGSSKK